MGKAERDYKINIKDDTMFVVEKIVTGKQLMGGFEFEIPNPRASLLVEYFVDSIRYKLTKACLKIIKFLCKI